MEVLKEEKKIYSNSRKLQNLLALAIEKKQDEVFGEQQRILRKLSELKTVTLEFFELHEQYKKLDKKLELLDQCMSAIYKQYR